MIRELERLAREGWLRKGGARFLDLGTGNGHMLFALREPPDSDYESDVDGEDAGGTGSGAWEGEMLGVDYSAQAVDLARRIAEQRRSSSSPSSSSSSSGPSELRFETWDLLTQAPSRSWLGPEGKGFDVVLDKGTFDAISLMPRPASTAEEEKGEEQGEHPCTIYRSKVLPLVRPERGFLVITSCNWTKEELVGWLAPSGDGNAGEDEGLELFREAEYPTFTFGGVKGQSVVTLIFRRRGGR